MSTTRCCLKLKMMKYSISVLDSNNIEGCLIGLMLLGTLRYLGRGVTFDDPEEQAAICGETHRIFIHRFLLYGSAVFYEKYVKTSLNHDELREHDKPYKMAGYPGCIGPSDATHVTLEYCKNYNGNVHKVYKLNHPSRSYNVTSNHGRISSYME